MSKIAIISDIHSNPTALLTVLKDVEQQKCDRIVCLGDIVGYGYDPNGCIDICRERDIECLIGNHDAGLAGSLSLDWFNPFAKNAILRQRPLVTEDRKEWLRLLPYSLVEREGFSTKSERESPIPLGLGRKRTGLLTKQKLFDKITNVESEKIQEGSEKGAGGASSVDVGPSDGPERASCWARIRKTKKPLGVFAGLAVGDHHGTQTHGDGMWEESHRLQPWENVKPDEQKFKIAFVHGELMSPKEFNYINGYSDAALEFYELASDGIRVLFVGHTHYANAFVQDNSGEIKELFIDPEDEKPIDLSLFCRAIVNVGSVGYPRNQPYSIYGIYDTASHIFKHRILPFDFDDYEAKMKSSGAEVPLWLSSRKKQAEDRQIGFM